MALIDKLKSVADAIRGKTGKTEEMTLDQMAAEIAGIETGGGAWTADDIAQNAVPFGDIVLTVEQIGAYAFYDRDNLISVSSDTAKIIGSNAFRSCSELESVYFPAVERLEQNAFYNCTMLKNLNLPGLTFLAYGALMSGSFEKIDIGEGLSKTSGSAFGGCKDLSVLILRRTEGVVALANINDFAGTPFASGGTGGVAYVPAALIEQYQQATNWSTLYAAGTCNFVAIEGSEYE